MPEWRRFSMPAPAAPAISVVMPAFNRAGVIGRAVQSVLDQEFGDFELVVVDDGSSDGTVAAVEAFTDPRIRLICLEANAGGNAARNRGIREARAPLIAFLDSDDYYLPEKLRFVTDYFAARPAVDVLIDSFLKVYPDGSGRPDKPRPNPVTDDNEALLAALFTRKIYKATPGINCRRDAAVRAGLFDETLKRRQDFDFIVRLAEVARCASTNRILWVKTNSPDAISANIDSFPAAILAFHDRHPAYLDHPQYRAGFALDLARHFNRLLARARFRDMVRDARPFAARLGGARFATMLASGLGQLIRRRFA